MKSTFSMNLQVRPIIYISDFVLEEIENELDMKPEEQRHARKKIKKTSKIPYGSNKKKLPKKKKQHVIDEDDSLSQSMYMTQGWRVTRDQHWPGNQSMNNSAFNDSNFSSAKNKKVRMITERLFNGGSTTHHHKHENISSKSPNNVQKKE